MGLSSIMDFSVYIWILPFCLQTKKNYDLETKLFVSCVLKKIRSEGASSHEGTSVFMQLLLLIPFNIYSVKVKIYQRKKKSVKRHDLIIEI